MKKLIGLCAAALVIPAGIASAALFSPGVAGSDPGSGGALNVVGEPYGRAVGILKSQGVKPTFGGSFGSDMPQSQCIVEQQKMTSSGKVILLLDCTQAAADHATDSAPASGGGGGIPGAPNVGSNGVTTVTPTPVGPQPGM